MDFKCFQVESVNENDLHSKAYMPGYVKVVLDPKANDLVAGIVLTSPVIRVEPGHPVLAVSVLYSSFNLFFRFSEWEWYLCTISL